MATEKERPDLGSLLKSIPTQSSPMQKVVPVTPEPALVKPPATFKPYEKEELTKVGFWVSKPFAKRLKLLSAETGKNFAESAREALESLLQSHGL